MASAAHWQCHSHHPHAELHLRCITTIACMQVPNPFATIEVYHDSLFDRFMPYQRCHEGDGPFPHLSWTTDSLSIFAFLIPCLTHIPSPLTGLPGRRRHCRPALAARSRSPTPSVPPPAVACAERGCWRQAAGTAASKSLDALSPLSAPAYRRCGRRRPTPPHDRAAAGESLAYVGGPIATCMRRARAQPVTPRPHDL